MAVGDYDRDGCLDLVLDAATAFDNQFGGVYRNACNDHHYLRVELVGNATNRNGLGARIIARAGSLRQIRELLGGSGFYQKEPIAHFGLGARTQVDTLEVRWPSGQIDLHIAPPIDQHLRLFEGEAGYHVVEPTQWEHNLPDTLEVGATLAWEAQVQPALFAPDARITQVTADLSAYGGSPALPLALEEGGIYRLPSESLVVEGLPGQREVTVLIEQTSAAGPVWTQLVHPIQVVPRDRPEVPLSVFADGLAPGWQVEGHVDGYDTTTPEVELIQDGRVGVEHSSSPVFRGQTALAVQVDSLAFAWSTFETFRLSFRTPEPEEHYRALHFAFHPGTAEVVVIPIINVFINDRHLSSLSLTSDPAFGFVSRTVVDLDIREWQVVELPLDFPGLEGPIESIALAGWLAGTFYLDEVQLLPDLRPPSATAVLEEHAAAQPQAFALAPNYPNPFNSGTVIRFDLPAQSNVELGLYNLAGQKVTTLVQGMRPAGAYTVRWDGRDANGRDLASGVYLYQLRTEDGHVESRKLALLR